MTNKLLHIIISVLFIVSCSFNIAAQRQWFTNDDDFVYEVERSINSYIKQGDSLKNIKAYTEADNYYQKAYQLSFNQKDTVRNDIGFSYVDFLIKDLNNYEKAHTINQQLYESNCIIDNAYGIIRATYYEANILDEQKNFKNALIGYSKALNLLENTNYTYYKWASHSKRGTVLFNLDPKNRLMKVKVDYEKSISYLSDANNIEEKVITYSNYASFQGSLDINKSVQYFGLANKYCDKIPANKYCYAVYNNLAYIYLMKKQPKKALKILEERMDFEKIKKYTNVTYPAVCFHTLGEVYLTLNQDSLAIKNIKYAQGFYKKANLLMFLVQASEQLTTIYQKQGDIKKANEELRNIKLAMELFHEEELDKQITQIKSVQQLEDKQSKKVDLEHKKKIIVAQKNKAKSINQFLVLFLVFFVFIILIWSAYDKLKFHQLSEKINYNRLRSLQINMNSHFLFNSFSTLQNYILKNEERKAVGYMNELSGLMKSVFSSSHSFYINFNDEVEVLKSYVALEQGRFHNSFEVCWDVTSSLISNNPMIPSMMIQPHIENAIIHGFSHSKAIKQLVISFGYKNESHVYVSVKDNGVGRSEAARIKEQSGATTQSLSIATKNIQERMDIMKTSGLGEASVTVVDLKDASQGTQGTEVHLILPIINKNKLKEPYVEEYNH